jgi:integrase
LRDRLRRVANHRLGVERFVGPRQNRVTVGELLGDMIRDYEMRGVRSLRTARAHVAHLRDHFGSDLAVTVTADRIRGYISLRKADGAAPSTIDRETEKLNHAFVLAVRDGKLSFRPPVPKLTRPHENARQGFVERAQFQAILAVIEDSDVVDFAEWLYVTGMRRGEALSLTWETFDRESWTIRLHASKSKNGRGRVLALEGDFRSVIERRIERRLLNTQSIFHRNGRRMGDFSKLWRSACEKTGIPGLRLHDLRRSAVRNLIRAGVPQAVAMAISGHETEAMFRRYNIVSDSDLREAARKVTTYLAGVPGRSVDLLPTHRAD